MPDFKRAPATPPLRVPPPPTWAAMQRLLAEGQGWVRSREVYRVERWHGAASTKRFDGRVVTDPAFTALCTECGKTFATHGMWRSRGKARHPASYEPLQCIARCNFARLPRAHRRFALYPKRTVANRGHHRCTRNARNHR